MARILSHSFTKYQNDEENKILSVGDDLDERGQKFVRQLCASLKVTSEDLSRIYSPSEVKQLCLRTKVRVKMTLFNCVWEAKQRLEKKGRLANRSERFVNAMLVKAVARQMVIPYTPEEISKCNHIRECQLKKFNNCRLNRWRNESSQGSVLERSHPNQSSFLPPAQVAKESSDIPLNCIVAIDSQALLTQPEMWVDGETPEIPGKSKDVAGDVDVSIESTPDMGWVEAAAQVNTESITFETLDLELNTQQTESQPVALGIEDYERFGTQVPATSTQTQHTEPFL